MRRYLTKRIVVRFYCNASGREPVREWLKGLDPEDRKIIGTDIKEVELGWPVGMPLCRHLTGFKYLWEVRSQITAGRIARVIFYLNGMEMILLHGFVKKSQKTPKKDIDLANERKREHEKHGKT